MTNLVVTFEYEPIGSDSLPEDQRKGVGAVTVSVDKLPETVEEFREIARTIGTMRTAEKTEDYHSVNLLHLAVVDDALLTPPSEIPDGDIVI